jgi:succinate dehydrogenase hydrophobic anchor subunit
MASRSRNLSLRQRGLNFEMAMRWGFMPSVTHVQSTDVPELDPWATPFWKLTACAMLLLGAAHGIHGLVVIADDYVVTARGRRLARQLSIVFLITMSAVGVWLIWTS